jgi:hypothetical protein
VHSKRNQDVNVQEPGIESGQIAAAYEQSISGGEINLANQAESVQGSAMLRDQKQIIFGTLIRYPVVCKLEDKIPIGR